jgi:hypothetical protein
MPKILSKLDLDKLADRQCDGCGCIGTGDGVYLYGRCHPRQPAFISYERTSLISGLLRVECSVCGQLIMAIRIDEVGL